LLGKRTHGKCSQRISIWSNCQESVCSAVKQSNNSVLAVNTVHMGVTIPCVTESKISVSYYSGVSLQQIL